MVESFWLFKLFGNNLNWSAGWSHRSSAVVECARINCKSNQSHRRSPIENLNFSNATDTLPSIIRCSFSGNGRIPVCRRTIFLCGTRLAPVCIDFDKNWNRTPNLIYACWCFLHLIFGVARSLLSPSNFSTLVDCRGKFDNIRIYND